MPIVKIVKANVRTGTSSKSAQHPVHSDRRRHWSRSMSWIHTCTVRRCAGLENDGPNAACTTFSARKTGSHRASW